MIVIRGLCMSGMRKVCRLSADEVRDVILKCSKCDRLIAVLCSVSQIGDLKDDKLFMRCSKVKCKGMMEIVEVL